MLRTLNLVIFSFARKGKTIAPIITPDLYSQSADISQNINIAKNNQANINQSQFILKSTSGRSSTLRTSPKQTQQSTSSIFKKQQFELSQSKKQEFQAQYEQNIQNKIRESVTKQLSYIGQDPSPNKLVNRPAKGVLWGLGGQLILASKKIQLEGIKDNLQEIVQFLQLNQVKNIYIHDFHKQNPDKPQTNRKRFSILGSCYSARHCWKTGTQLKNAFNLHSGKTKIRKTKEYDPIFASKTGGKDEQFILVQYKNYSICLLTEQQREAMDLEWKWNNQASDEVMDKYTKLKLNKKGRKNHFQDL